MNIKIPEVTLVAVDCTDRVPGTINALTICTRNIDFGRVKLLSHRQPDYLPDFIEYNEIPKINNIDEYNQFMFMDLGYYTPTSHCLTVQDHAYILHSELFDPSWLQYDYCGSPWPIIENAYLTDKGERIRVGNGGFSLRSRKLLLAPRSLDLHLEQRQNFWNEDGNICVYQVDRLSKYGIKYMPLEESCKFAYENNVPENLNIKKFFGYHRNKPNRDI